MNSDRPPQHHATAPDPFHPWGEGSARSSLRRELGILFRSKRLIGTTVGISLLLATVYNYGTRPLYEATAVLSLQSSPDTPFIPRTSQDQTRLTQAIDLQVRRLKSRDMALAATRSLEPGLAQDLAKGELGDAGDRLLTEFRYRLGLMNSVGQTTADQVRIFRSRLKVQYTNSERVVYVRFTAYDRESATRAVGRLLDSYLEEIRKDAQGAIGQRQEALAETVAERQGEVVETLDKLQDLESKDGLQNAEARRTMLERELVRLQESLIVARASRQQKRAVLDETRRLATADVVTLPMFRDDREIADALQKIAELEPALARATATLGERHPDLVALRSDAEEARKRLSLRVIALRGAVEREFDLAQREENDIVGSIDTAQRNLTRLGRSALEQSFIRKEADAGQKVVGELIEKSVREREAQILFMPAVVQRPETAADPVSPQRARNFQYALGIGLVLGIGLAWLRAHLDETVKTPDDIEGQFDTPLLGMVPQAPAGTFSASDLFAPEKISSSQMFEAYRVLRTNLTLTDRSSGPRHAILVTSSREAEGKTTTSCGLATSLALDGHRVLLIDCDLRRASLSRLLKAKDRPGLTDALSGRPLDRCITPTPLKGLDLLPSGSPHPNPAEVLGRVALVDLLESLRPSYDWILCDAPPALAVADAAILARVADSVIVVVGANVTPVGAIRATLKQIRAVHASVRGLVLNSVDLKRDAHYFRYYYAGHYADYSSEKLGGSPGAASRKL